MLKTVLLTSLLFTVPVVAIRVLGGFEGLELAAYDAFMRRRPAESMDDRIVVVTINDDDIEELQQFPIHDGTLAGVLQKLESYQPAAIGLDIARDVPQGPVAGRKQLSQVIEKSAAIVSACLLSSSNHPGSPPAPGTPAEGAAFADFPIDVDKTVRRTILVSTPAKTNKPVRREHVCNDASTENEIPSLSFQLATMYLAGQEIKPEATANSEIQLRQQVLSRLWSGFGGYAHMDADDYQMMLNYRGANQVFQEVSINQVLQNKVDPGSIRDRVVLIGYTSEVSKDTLSTPFIETQSGSRSMHGVMVHANAVSQILSAVLDQRPLIQSWSKVGEVLWIFAWSLGSGVIAFYNRRLGWFLIVLVASGGLLWGICYALFLYQGLWVPFVPTLTVMILTALGVRLLDLANRTGYAQAVYEHLRENMIGNSVGRDRTGDYLESLVRRARAVRQGQDAKELMAVGDDVDAFATPEMKALYEQIAHKVRKDVAAEQSARQAAMAKTPGNSKLSRINALLNRAQYSRTQIQPAPPLGVQGNAKSPEVSP